MTTSQSGSATEGTPVRPALAAAYGAVLWAAATAGFIAAGEAILPDADSTAVVPVLLALLAGTAGAVALIAADYVRRTGLRGPAAGLAFGALVAVTGLVLDGAYLLAFGFDPPGLDGGETDALVAYLLLAYPLVVLVPWATGRR